MGIIGVRGGCTLFGVVRRIAFFETKQQMVSMTCLWSCISNRSTHSPTTVLQTRAPPWFLRRQRQWPHWRWSSSSHTTLPAHSHTTLTTTTTWELSHTSGAFRYPHLPHNPPTFSKKSPHSQKSFFLGCLDKVCRPNLRIFHFHINSSFRTRHLTPPLESSVRSTSVSPVCVHKSGSGSTHMCVNRKRFSVVLPLPRHFAAGHFSAEKHHLRFTIFFAHTFLRKTDGKRVPHRST